MPDKPEDKSIAKAKDKAEDKAEDNNSINFKNAAIQKIKNLQSALDKEKSKKKKKPVVTAATRLRGMRSFGENYKASKSRNA
jgi:predicted transcriptional regulator